MKDEFKVNTALARGKANDRKYTSDDESVLKYFYAKIELLRAVEDGMEVDKMIDEIWLGLPPNFRLAMNYNEVKKMDLQELGQFLNQKDLSYRETLRNQSKFRERDSKRSEKRPYDYGRSTGAERNKRYEEKTHLKDRGDEKPKKMQKSKDRESARKWGSSRKEKSERSSTKGKSNPKKVELLPKDQWREDEKGRTMRRKCRFCNKWHMDYDCPERPSSYNISVSFDQAPPSDSDDEERELSPTSHLGLTGVGFE